jgi:hypothetical protein
VSIQRAVGLEGRCGNLLDAIFEVTDGIFGLKERFLALSHLRLQLGNSKGRARHSVRAGHDLATSGAHGATRPTCRGQFHRYSLEVAISYHFSPSSLFSVEPPG